MESFPESKVTEQLEMLHLSSSCSKMAANITKAVPRCIQQVTTTATNNCYDVTQICDKDGGQNEESLPFPSID